MHASLITSLGYVRVAAASPRLQPADVEGNVTAILSLCERAEQKGSDVIVLPELCITGYTCGDLFRQYDLLSAAIQGLERIRRWTTGRRPLVAVGLPLVVGSRLYNVAALVHDGHIRALVPKVFLPSTQEFYDFRWFTSGAQATLQNANVGHTDIPFGANLLLASREDPHCIIGAEICEDLWAVQPPSGALTRAGATLILNLSASNELVTKAAYRRSLVAMQSARTYTAYAYASAGPWESTTDTVFSGHCMIAECGEMLVESERLGLGDVLVLADVDLRRCVAERLNGTSFSQEPGERSVRTLSFDIHRSTKSNVERVIVQNPFLPAKKEDRTARCEDILNLQATALAVRLHRVGSERCVFGLSGGLDSTLAAIVCMRACDLLERTHDSVLAVTMPGFGTTDRTLRNARDLAVNMGFDMREISIKASVEQHFTDIGHDPNDHSVVYENAQARERTQILMDLANKHQGIVIGTGDLSELALGWSTYNADHMSMYSVNGGVPKTLVRHIVQWYAEERCDGALRKALQDVLNTPISPELLPPGAEGDIVQHTESVLGPYVVHDFFLYHLIRLQEPVRSVGLLAILAFEGTHTPSDILTWLEVFVTRFAQQQFKRSCMPDTVKIGSVALSPRADWRMPSDASASMWLNELYRLKDDLTD